MKPEDEALQYHQPGIAELRAALDHECREVLETMHKVAHAPESTETELRTTLRDGAMIMAQLHGGTHQLMDGLQRQKLKAGILTGLWAVMAGAWVVMFLLWWQR